MQPLHTRSANTEDEMQYWLRSTISRGQFSGEFAAQGETVDGKGFSLFAEADDVKLDKPLSAGRDAKVDGWLRVDVVDQGDGQMLVKLPSQALERGYFITVPARNVSSHKQ